MSVVTEVSTVGFRAGYRDLVSAVKAAGVIGSRSNKGGDRLFLEVGEQSVVVAAAERSQMINVQVEAVSMTAGRLVLGHAAVSKALAAAGKGCRKAELDRLQVGISMNPEQGTAALEVDGYSVPLACLSVEDDFPDPIAPGPASTVVDLEQFGQMFIRVTAAAGRDELLAVFTHVHTVITPGKVELWATDRYRASHGTVPAVGDAAGEVLLPATIVTKLLPLLGGQTVAIGLSSHHSGDKVTTLSVDGITVQLVSPQLDFPRLGHLFPDAASTVATATLERSKLHHAAVRAAALTAALGEKHTPVRITLAPDTVTVAPTSTTGPGAGPVLPATTTGIVDDWTVGANRDYLVAALAQLPEEPTTIHLTAPTKPVMLTSTDDFRHLLMPVRL